MNDVHDVRACQQQCLGGVCGGCMSCFLLTRTGCFDSQHPPFFHRQTRLRVVCDVF